MDPTTVERLIQSHFDRTITPAERQQLEQLLLEKPETCQRFWEEARWHLLMHTAVESQGETVEESEVSVGKYVFKAPSKFSQATGSLLRLLTHSLPQALHPRHHTARFATTVTILTATFWAVLFALVWDRDRADFPNAKTQHVATITHIKDAVWAQEQVVHHRGARLAAGHRLELEKGLVHIEFRDGARVVIEGPAVLRVDAPGVMTLDRGRLLAHVPERAIGFTVKTPLIDIIDLGTEFGVEVRAENTEVQVFQGKVQIQGPNDLRDSARAMVAGQATVFGISPQQGFYAKEKKMNRAIYLGLVTMLATSANTYANATPITFQGTGVTDDATLISAFSQDNFGGTGTIDVGTTAGIRRSLLRFPTLSSALNGETVASASLTLGTQLAFFGPFTNETIFLHAVTSANANWAEGSGTDTGTQDTGLATWGEKIEGPGGTAWAGSAGLGTAGTDYVTTPVGSFTASSTDTVGGTTYTVNFADVSFLQNWIDNPSQNGGFLLRSPTLEAGSHLIRLSSSEGGTPPLLSVELLSVPEPATGALLGLGGMMVVGFARKRRRSRRED